MKSEKDRSRQWVLLLLLLSHVEAFLNYPYSRPSFSARHATLSVDEHNARAARFHGDMVRLLESRSQCVQKSTRRERPVILQNDTDGAERVLAMLQHMVDLGVSTEESYAIAMDAILRRGRTRWKDNDGNVICAADQLEVLLQQLEYQDNCASISVVTYNTVLEGYAICATPRGDRNYAKRAQALLERMMEEDVFDVHSLVHTLHAWAWQQANLQRGECALKAQELVEQIEEMTNDASLLIQCYDWVLEAWSKSKSEGSPARANEAFLRMKQLTTNQTWNCGCCLPNAESYSNAILAWSKCTQQGSAERAHELLCEMVETYKAGALWSEPELIAFNGCITAWARIGRAQKAESILWLLEDIRPNCSSLRPDVLTYNAVLHAHVLSHDKKKALDKVIAIVQHMEDQCVEQPAMTPDSFTYNTLMKAWVQSGQPEAPEQAEAILEKMERLGDNYLTTRNFNMVINAYAKSKDRFAANKAHGLLRRMEQQQQQQQPASSRTTTTTTTTTAVHADIISYTSVMECYARSSRADPNASVVAVELLETCFEKSIREASLRPNLRTFTMAILALASCPREGNARKARELLTRLVELYERTGDMSLQPNAYPYNYVLNCAANTMTGGPDKLEAFAIATKTFSEMRRSNNNNNNSTLVPPPPDSFTYAFWIKACNNLLPSRSELHTKCVSLAFEECKKNGLVTNEVLTRLQQGSSAKVVQSLLGNKTITTGYRNLYVQDLSPSWSRNAKRNRKGKRTM